jgi:flagellar basal body rod protein FlgC
VRVASNSSATNLNDADIVISGQLLDFSANAKSRPFSTVVTTSSRMVISARNIGDQSSTIRSVEGAQRATVVWFSEDDVQQLLAATLKDSIDRYIAETTIEQKALRPVR